MKISLYKIVFLTIYLTFVSVLSAQKNVNETVSKANFSSYPFHNTQLEDEERVKLLLSLMTEDEKIKALSDNLQVPRLGIPGCTHVEGLHGLTMGGPPEWGGKGKTIPTTTFPQAYGLGATWDTTLMRRIGDWEAEECRYIYQKNNYERGGIIVRSPNVDLGRDIRWGRTEEIYGEDPWLVSKMSVAMIRGLQGDHPRYWKTASLMKHYLANSHEFGRVFTSSDFDEQLFYEYYGYPFYKGITEGGSRCFMAAYNSYNGIPCTVHPTIKEVTQKKWGLDGIVCTDAGALNMLVTQHHYYSTPAQAAAGCVKAGINQFVDRYEESIREALSQKLISISEIDSVLAGNYRVALKLGLLDRFPEKTPYGMIGRTEEEAPWLTQEAKDLAREATRKSVVLLKNDKNILPLDKNKIKKILVVGERADEVLLDWYSGTPPYSVSVLQGIRNAVGKGVEVKYFKRNYIDSAMYYARNADAVIVCLGNHPWGNAGWEQTQSLAEGKEAVDRFAITTEQEDLVRQMNQVNSRTIALLVSSFPYAIEWTAQHIPAILQVTNNSQELGNGVADVIFGDYNPAGRLTQTWVKNIEQLPPMLDYNIRNGRTYMYYTGEPLFSFGHGLSYTQFRYSNLTCLRQQESGTMSVSLDITNVGDKEGDEVVQLYVEYPKSKQKRPKRQLRGFDRIHLRSGETKTVTFKLTDEDLSYYDISSKSYVLESGKIKFMVGASSTDIRKEKSLAIEK